MNFIGSSETTKYQGKQDVVGKKNTQKTEIQKAMVLL